eukprot:gene14160-5161_t
MTEGNEIEKCKEDALNCAAKYVANLLQRPDQLDKVEQIRRRVLRTKASVDSRLKTAVQSQLDGIRSGLNELKSAVGEIGEVKEWIQELDGAFDESSVLNKHLSELRLQQSRHAQLAKTNEHLKQIFNVPETVEKTRSMILEGNYLQAHKNLMELEATRDEILFEVHQQKIEQGIEFLESEPLDLYFSRVGGLSDLLAKQLWTVISQTLSAARSNPTQIVTALRIIEREERSDRRALEQQKKTNFLPATRPKVWKSRCMAVIRKSVDNRFESNQLELDRRTDKMWLVRHLERMRAFILEDLVTVKELVRPCFPATYEIFKEYAKIYHEATSRTLEDLAMARNDPSECITLLTWIKDYYGEELMGNDEFAVDQIDFNLQEELGPLLSRSVLESLNDTYLKTTERNMQSWLSKMVETESQDWLVDKPPETDVDGYYQTSLPIILFQMLDQNLQVAAQIEKGMEIKVLDACITALIDFTIELQNAIKCYKEKHFGNRSILQYFEAYMIAIINNCQSITVFGEQMKNQKRAELSSAFGETRLKNFEEVIVAFQRLGEEACTLLLDGALIDLQEFFTDLMTKKWLKSNVAVDTMVLTFEDYNRDYVHLKPSYAKFIMEKAEEKLVIEYVKAIMSRRITFRSFEERKDAGNQIIEEANKIAEAFTRLAKLPPLDDSPCCVLAMMAEVLKVKDSAIVSLEISGLAEKYPDFRAEHALALLSLRGDMGRTESKQKQYGNNHRFPIIFLFFIVMIAF